jgi:hypothetical protein
LHQVNGDDLVGADHYDAVDVLKTAGNNIVMVLGREKIPKDVRNFGVFFIMLIYTVNYIFKMKFDNLAIRERIVNVWYMNCRYVVNVE